MRVNEPGVYRSARRRMVLKVPAGRGRGAGGGVVHGLSRRVLVSTGGLVLAVAMAAMAAPAPAAQVQHDFDPATLAQYLSLRFSSAVPPIVIQHALAAEGFSQRDL